MKRLTILLSAAAIMLSGATMTSCVKNDESQSVQDIRSAKAAQLNALAKLASSQAEAALINANADKVLKEAQAALAKAEAAVQQALADKDQVAIEKAKLELAEAKATHQHKIDQMIADALLAKETSLKNLKDFMDQAAITGASNAVLDGLKGKYATELGNWNTVVGNLIAAKAALSTAEIGLADVELTKENSINDNKVIIASAEGVIEMLKKIDVSDKADTQKKLDKATAEEEAAKAETKSVKAAEKAPEEALKSANNAYVSANTDYAAAVALIAAEDATAISLKTATSVDPYKYEYTINGQVFKPSIAGVNSYAAIDKYDQTKIDAVKAAADPDTKKELIAACALVKANKTAYEAAVKAAQEAELPLQVAKSETAIATAQEAEITRVKGVYAALISGYADVPALIEAQTAKITAAKQDIADMSEVETQEQLIDYTKEQIVDLEREMAISQAQLDSLKAAIEAELNK